MDDVRFEGFKMRLGGVEYIIPALSLKQVRLTLKDDLAAMQGGGDEAFSSGLNLITAALQRNYPAMTADAVEELIDMRNFPVIVKAIMGQSGLEERAPGEALGSS